MAFKIRALTQEDDNQLVKMTLSPVTLLQEIEDVELILKLKDELVRYDVIIGAEYNTDNLNGCRFTSYLMQDYSSILSTTSCVFNIYKINSPGWTQSLVYTGVGIIQGNNQYFLDLTDNDLTLFMNGDPTLMVESIIVRLGKTYKNRIYLNQLGIFGETTRIKKDVQYLDLTKQDE